MRSKPTFLLGLLLAIVLALGYHLQPKPRYQIEAAAPGQMVSEEHFSPSENLERMDYDRLERAQRRVDIAMYGFTDRYLAEELVRLARKGVAVRLYRDREQYENELRNA